MKVSVCLCVCVCVQKREREGSKECVCVCVKDLITAASTTKGKSDDNLWHPNTVGVSPTHTHFMIKPCKYTYI